MMLADADLSSIPDTFWKNFCIALLVLLGVALAAVIIWSSLRKRDPVKIADDPAVEVRKAPKRFNFDLCKKNHEEIEHRLNELEVWRHNEMIAQAQRNQRLMFALGKIAQKLGVDIAPSD